MNTFQITCDPATCLNERICFIGTWNSHYYADSTDVEFVYTYDQDANRLEVELEYISTTTTDDEMQRNIDLEIRCM